MPRGAVPVLDRLITLQFPAPPNGDDDYGHQSVGEPEEVKVWAKRMDAAPRDQLDWDNDARLNVNTAVFIIRWHPKGDGRVGGPAEHHRRRGAAQVRDRSRPDGEPDALPSAALREDLMSTRYNYDCPHHGDHCFQGNLMGPCQHQSPAAPERGIEVPVVETGALPQGGAPAIDVNVPRETGVQPDAWI